MEWSRGLTGAWLTRRVYGGLGAGAGALVKLGWRMWRGALGTFQTAWHEGDESDGHPDLRRCKVGWQRRAATQTLGRWASYRWRLRRGDALEGLVGSVELSPRQAVCVRVSDCREGREHQPEDGRTDGWMDGLMGIGKKPCFVRVCA